MFDIGGWEFLIVIVIAIIVIGPKDLPGTVRTVSSWVRRARELAREFQSGLDDLAREADMESVKSDIQSGLGLDEISDAGNSIRNRVENTIDPDGTIGETFKDDYSEIEEDGPFSDNSFEEDEDVDGADDDEGDTVESDVPGSAEPQKVAMVEAVDPDGAGAPKETSGQSVKKAD